MLAARTNWAMISGVAAGPMWRASVWRGWAPIDREAST